MAGWLVGENLVCAGIVRTELWRNMSEPDRNGLFAKAGQALPVGRVEEPEDLAETYLYLMRERFSTGAIIVVDGEALWFKAVYEPVFSMPFKVNCCKKNRTPKPEGF